MQRGEPVGGKAEIHADVGHAEQAPAAQPQPAVARLRRMLAQGRPDPKAIAELIEREPASQREVVALLHQTVGNAFVQQVLGALPRNGGTVQRKSDGPAAAADPAGTAKAGVQAASDRLPHHDAIQASFGRHDVSAIRAQTGGSAAEASRELGASAYAVGDRVGFAQSPDLHTAAHEAAHVVQQQAGVQLKGGIDRGKDDAYEQHADQVADKVVRGESAEVLLDKVGPAKTTGSTTVQRKEAPKTPRGMVNARRYLSFNAVAAHTAIELHLKQQRLPQPHPRMQWHDERAFYEALFVAFNAFARSFEHPEDFAQALFPGDPFHLIDSMRPIAKVPPEEATDEKQSMYGGVVGPMDWQAGIGTALAQMIEQAVIQSLYRLGPRWLEVAELAGPASGTVFVDANAITRSHPMDRYVRGAMCQPNVFTVVKDAAATKKPAKKPKHDGTGVKPVQLEWVGKQDPKLWNWVRATPATATAEDVSATLFAYMAETDGDKTPDYYAAFLTQAPPMFGIPPQWAKTFPETRAYRPANDKIAAADSDPDHQMVELGASKLGDAQALVEATPGATADKKAKAPEPGSSHDELIADVISQGTFLKGKLASWALAGEADKAIAFANRRKDDQADAAKWLPALTAQRENLSTIATGILQLDTAVEQMKLKSKTGEEARPLREIMRFYGDAVATAHLKDTAKKLILRAANAQSALTLQGLQASVHDMDTSADMMRGSVANSDWDRNHASNAVSHLDDEGLALQTRMMRGEAVNADDVEDYQVRVEEASLDSKMIAIEYALAELAHSADEAGSGLAAWFAALPSSKFRHLGEATQAIRDKVSDVRFHWNSAKDRASIPTDEQAEHGVEERKFTLANRRTAVNEAKAAFVKASKDEDISGFLKSGANTVKWQSFRTACVKVAALIGVSLIGGFVGGMIARGAASLMMGAGGATAVEGLSLGGSIVARGLGMATETVVTSAGQTAIFGGGYGTNFLENMIMTLGTTGVMKMIGESAGEAMKVEKAVGGMWSKASYGAKVVLSETAVISGHMIMGVAAGYVAHRIVTGESQPPPATVEEWLLQGASIAVGRYVGHGIAAHAEARHKLALADVEGAAKLATDAERLTALARQAEHSPQAKDAMELLAKRHQLLTEEMKVLEELEKSPAKMKAAKISKTELAKTRSELKTQLRDSHSEGFAEVALHTSGMQELIPGALWSGTPSEIGDLIVNAKEAGLEVHAKKDPQGGKWHLNVQGKEIVVEERLERTGKPDATKSGAGGSVKDVPEGPGRRLDNAPAISQRASSKLQALAAPERAKVEEVFARAENPGQHSMLERALAAGHGVGDLDALRAAMHGMSSEQVAKTFTGEGVVQFYQQSCVPASYQIAIAEVDPYYAFQLRNHPEMVMQEQRDALIERGSAQTKRKDVRKGPAAKNMQEHLDDPGMGARVKDEAHYSDKGDSGGVETTEMPGSSMQDQLQKATGEEYEVITDDRAPYKKAGQGKYRGGTPPHEAIAAAVAAGKPVIVATRMGGASHAQVIVGSSVSATGERVYQIIDPYSGKLAEYPESMLDMFGAHSVTLPKEFAEGAKIQAPHAPDPHGVKTGGADEIHAATEFMTKLRASNAAAADELVAAGYKAEQFSDTPHVLKFLETGSNTTKSNMMKNFVAKTGLGPAAGLKHFDEYLQYHPSANGAELKKVGNAIGEMVKGKLSCSHAQAIETAIRVSANPRYAADRSVAIHEVRSLLGDNISPEVAEAELLRPSPFGDDVTSVKVAGAGKLGPDIKMETATGKRVGREMQVVGAGVDTPKTADAAKARGDLENALAKAIKDKATDFMRPAVGHWDSQEIIIQIAPSAHDYNFDAILAEPGLVERVIDRAWTSTDYIKALGEAEGRLGAGKVKKPDRIAIYNSAGTQIYPR